MDKMIHIEDSIGSDMLDLVERHEITGVGQKALMLGKKENNDCYIDSFVIDEKDAGIYLEDRDEMGILLYSFFQQEDIENAEKDFLASSSEFPQDVLFGLVSFDQFLLFQKTKENVLEPIKNFIFEQHLEGEKVAG